MNEWPFVGRTSDLELLTRWVTDPGCRGAVLVGAAGVGKTRLAREVTRWARTSGIRSQWVVGTRSAQVLPFGAVATLLSDTDHGQVGRIDNRADLLRRYVRGIEEAAGRHRSILVVDDSHLLDDASATLIHQLAVRGNVFVLATVRAGVAVPDPVTALWKDELAERLDVGGLDTAAIEALLSAVLDGQVDPASAAYLAVRCEGNVLFLRTFVQDAQLDGALQQSSGVWYLARPVAPSDRLVELVEGQLGALEPDERTMLELVCFGEPLAAEDLTEIGDLAIAEALERKGLITAATSDRGLEFSLGHPLYGDVLRSTMPRLRAQALARQLADALGRSTSRREDILRVAVWRLDGGGASAAQMLEAATIARWRYDFELAERLVGAAVEQGAGFEASLLAAQLASLRGRPEEAERQLADMAAVAATDAHRGRVASVRLDNLVLSLGQISKGFDIAAEAERGITDPHWRDQVAGRRLSGLIVDGGPAAALEFAEALGSRTDGAPHVFAGLGASMCLCRLGRVTQALEISARTHKEHLGLVEPMDWYPNLHLWVQCLGLCALGRIAEARALALEEYAKGLSEGCAEARAWFSWHLASQVGGTGHVRASARRAREAVALFRQLGRPLFARSASVPLAMALALEGRAAEAEEALGAEDTSDHSVLIGVERVRARGWVAVAHRDARAGRRLLEQAAALGEEIGDLVGCAGSLHDLARLGYGADYIDVMVRVSAAVEGDLVACQRDHMTALSAREPDRLLAVSERFAGMELDLLAAEAAFDAAVAWRAQGLPRKAIAAERHAAVLASGCEGAVTPAMRSVGPRVVLTRSERETALLAAAGHTNREIAVAQTLSIRTVQNRLQQVYRKLGISGREELDTTLA